MMTMIITAIIILIIYHNHNNDNNCPHWLLRVPPVNLEREQQARDHQQVLHDNQHELPHALIPAGRAAAVSIHPAAVHCCQVTSVNELSQPFEAVCSRGRCEATGNTRLVRDFFISACGRMADGGRGTGESSHFRLSDSGTLKAYKN